MDIEVADAVLLLIALLLGLPAVLRAALIAWFHHRFGPGACDIQKWLKENPPKVKPRK